MFISVGLSKMFEDICLFDSVSLSKLFQYCVYLMRWLEGTASV